MPKFKKGDPKPKNAWKFPKGHKFNFGNKYALGKHNISPEGKKAMIERGKRFKGRISPTKGMKLWGEKYKKQLSKKMKRNQFAKGNKLTEEHKRKISEFIGKTRNQENNPNWKGGKGRESKILYGSRMYKQWRRQVFQRDNYFCQFCGIKGTYLEAHHIKSWADYPELRFDLNNGMTLCKECHRKTDNFGFKKKSSLKLWK